MISEQDQTRDPDTMPAQGWLHVNARCSLTPITDAGRIPAQREESTMAPATIARGEIREDFGHAADRAQLIDHLALLDSPSLVEELERRSVADLRELHHQAAASESWHQQGVSDARDLSRTIGRILRAAGDEIDPQAVAAEAVVSVPKLASGGVR